MADQPASEQADPGAPQPEVSRPHDKYFQKVFSDTEDAASLLRSCVPPALGRTLRWSTLTHLPGRFVSDAWHDSEADLLFSVEREGSDDVPVLLYVLLEHQSTPDRWMPLRMLNYCTQVWVAWQYGHQQAERLPLIVPLVFYQGGERWEYVREFAELVADAEDWRWVPRFEHLLIDQTEQSPDSVSGSVGARLLQILMMAKFREAAGELLERATRMMRELYRSKGFAAVARHVEYVLATQPEEHRKYFAGALRRNVPGRGGDLMNYVEELIEQGRQEGRQKGRQEGQVRTIEGFLRQDLPWSAIEAATGIDEAAFRRLKQQLDTADGGARRQPD